MNNLLLDNNDLLWIKAVAGIDTAEAKRHFDNILSVGRALRILNTLTAAWAQIEELQAQLVLANKESSANVENALNHYSRAKQAEAQLEGLRATRTHLQKDVKELKAQLEKVRGLPEKWRREWYDPIRPDKCEFADELQAILEKDDER